MSLPAAPVYPQGTFFFDNNLAPNLVSGLRAFGENVVHLQEVLPRNARDVDVIPYVAQHGYFLLTQDGRMRRNRGECELIRQHRVGAFLLRGDHGTRCQIIQQAIRNWSAIKQYARENEPPYFVEVRPFGTKLIPYKLHW